MIQSPTFADNGISGENALEMLGAAGVGLYKLNLPTGSLVVSDAWISLLDLPEDTRFRTIGDITKRVHQEDAARFEDALEALVTGETPKSKTEFRLQTPEDRSVWVLMKAHASEIGPDGKPKEISGVVTDITERVERMQMQDEFVAMISHELRTPLTSMIGSLKMVNSGAMGELSGPIGKLLQLAQRNSNRLLHLVNELLDFKSLESGELSYEMTKLDAREVSSDATLSMQGYLQDDQTIREILPSSDDEIFLSADVNRLQQILANLLSNAAKFSPADAEIELGLDIIDGQVRYTVRDHGPGVPEELEGKMFKRFTQAKTGEKRKFKSTGLGLAICKQMTNGMGGDIGYFNNDDGGATFWVSFPQA